MNGMKFFFTTMAFFFLLWGISAVSAEKKQLSEPVAKLHFGPNPRFLCFNF
jgi:hypothetical protein